MPTCEKCWSDARKRSEMIGGGVVEHYRNLLVEREDIECSPEQQCGDLHVMIAWTDGRPDQCVCGLKKLDRVHK